MVAISVREIRLRGNEVVRAYKAWSDHARACPVCERLGVYSRLPGRTGGSLTAAYARLGACEAGAELWGEWRYEVDQLRLWHQEKVRG